MSHEVHKIVDFDIIKPFTLRIKFDDETERSIDFRNVLKGSLYGPLENESVFNQVEINPEIHTLVWPNGADFDPETLYNWPKYAKKMEQMARENWSMEKVA
ncbi:conserved hypothetical protein [Candidatus Desulfarcum epimagneticum]|uniref:DUF2442 domain-containing protein n=1 Tax=uncultured Desulfobacteraceae bacterium TaxID=218296 RepID=A0A484HIY7_9BACT|nr:conserved hypothetical protein [uncultured Desulfobacteraceae bacterium]